MSVALSSAANSALLGKRPQPHKISQRMVSVKIYT